MKNGYFLLVLLFPLFAFGQGDIGYHVTTTGNLFKTVNSGSSWSNTFTGTVQMIDFVDDSTGYYVSTSGNLFKTTDSGANWSNTFTSTVQFIDFVDDSTGYHVTTSGNLFKTVNSGLSWVNTFTGTVQMIDFVDDSTGYYVSTIGTLFKTTDSGANWSNTFTSTVQFIDFVNGFSISVGIAETDFGKELLLYPNPTKGDFSIDLGKNYPTIKMTVTDLVGKIIQTKTYNESQLLNLKVAEPAGVYLIVLESGDKKAVIRLIKE